MTEPRSTRSRFPEWLKKRIPAQGMGEEVRGLLRELRLATVCQSAHCPNQCECFAQGTATFMILGDTCTRDCRFCAVRHGPCAPPDPDEPERVAEAAARLKLHHVVVTSVTRDDLPDGGAHQFKETILALRRRLECRIEILTPDFMGDATAIEIAASAEPDVYNHNVETVPRLYPVVRPAADYQRSLALLKMVKEKHPDVATKSGLMVGLGETEDEVEAVMRDLRAAACDLLTIGQYLSPSPEHLPVQIFVTPGQFKKYENLGKRMGFAAVASGPFVRSSYHAGDVFNAGRTALLISAREMSGLYRNRPVRPFNAPDHDGTLPSQEQIIDNNGVCDS
jgi:lipoic acid synthetase